MKILAPVGNFESLKVAVAGGADEVYLGINQFNARNNIDGFDMTTLKGAVDFAHTFGVKVNLALNILFSDEELLSAVNIAVEAYNFGVDSFIIQDLGLAKILEDNYPEIEKHASTQMGLHNLEGVKALEKYNFRRIVLARETPLSEIKRIKENTDVEIEYFAHGALCVSFSGNCYMSSYLHDASGNRGRCKQLCRLPYTLCKDGKKLKEGYLLSAKDFNMIKRLDDLRSAGVDVLKIEGRARRPYYVYATTVAYKNALQGKKVDEKSILLAFNRGFTEGYFNGNSGIISKKQSHLGIKIGRVEKVKNGRNFNEIFIKTNEGISKKSTLKFFDERGDERAVASAFDVLKTENGYRITGAAKVFPNDSVHLISDGGLEDDVLKISPKRAIDIDVEIEENKEMKASFFVNGKEYTVFGDVVEKANSRPLLKKEIQDNFKKSELFNCNISLKKLDDVFVVKSVLNEFRRRVLNQVENALTVCNHSPLKKFDFASKKNYSLFDDFCFIEELSDLSIIKEKDIVYSPESYELSEVQDFLSACKKYDKNGYLDTPNFALEKDILLLKAIIDKTGVKIVANNYYALSLTDDFIVGGGLNVYNSSAAAEYGKPVILAENPPSKRTDFALMTLRHCPIKEHFCGDCTNCKYDGSFTIKSESGRVMKLKRKKSSSCTFYLV